MSEREPETVDAIALFDAERQLRSVYDALIEARPYVLNRTLRARQTLRDSRSERASDVLERVDAALASAGEYLS